MKRKGVSRSKRQQGRAEGEAMSKYEELRSHLREVLSPAHVDELALVRATIPVSGWRRPTVCCCAA